MTHWKTSRTWACTLCCALSPPFVGALGVTLSLLFVPKKVCIRSECCEPVVGAAEAHFLEGWRDACTVLFVNAQNA